MLGETIKDFTITAELGRGGMGEVYVAEQRIVKTRVAIKMLQPQISADQAHVDRFFNEAIAVSKIKHAGIVKIFDVGHHAGRAYLVMELLEGEPLATRLRRGLAFDTAIGFARQITNILEATHAAGITHRDLKPDNVFLVPDAELGERVRILDFGIAKLGDVQATAAQMSMGTPAYMAPELWRDAATSGPPTDVYALGCVLFELCTGRPPFVVTAVAEACGRHLSEVPPRVRSVRPELPAALDELIAAMLEKAQADRPTTKAIAATLASLSTSGIAATLPVGAATLAGATPVPMSPTPPSAPGAPATAVGHDSAGPSDPAKLEAEGRWMELVKLLGKQADAASSPGERAALHFKTATIYQDRFANLAEAIKGYERVLAHEPDHRKALDALRALYEKRRDWEKLLELEKGELGRTAPAKRADKAVEVARLAAARVSKPDVQRYWWERVIEHEPDHRQAFTELAKLYEHAEDWCQLAELLQHHAENAPGNDDRAAALRKLAVVHAELLNDPARAIASLEQVLVFDPRDVGAKQALDALRAGKPAAWSSFGGGYHVGPSRPPADASSTPATAPATPAIARDTGAARSMPTATDAPRAGAGASSRSSSRDDDAGASSRSSSDNGADGSERRASRASDPPARASSAKPEATMSKRIAIVGVLALGGAAVYWKTRTPEADTGGQGSQATGAHVGQATGLHAGGAHAGTGSQAEAAGTGSQAEAGGGSQRGSARAGDLVLSYRVLSKPAEGGEFRAIEPGASLATDDRLAFEVMVSEQAHVFLSQRPKGKPISVLFPHAGIDVTNPLPPNTWTRIPSGTRSFRLNDKDVGLETVYFVAARTPPPSLAAAIANQGKAGAKPNAVEDQLVAVAMENRSDCVGRGREIVLDGEGDCKAKTRGLELDDENQAKRVRGVTIDEVVFVPFSFMHASTRDRAVEAAFRRVSGFSCPSDSSRTFGPLVFDPRDCTVKQGQTLIRLREVRADSIKTNRAPNDCGFSYETQLVSVNGTETVCGHARTRAYCYLSVGPSPQIATEIVHALREAVRTCQSMEPR